MEDEGDPVWEALDDRLKDVIIGTLEDGLVPVVVIPENGDKMRIDVLLPTINLDRKEQEWRSMVNTAGRLILWSIRKEDVTEDGKYTVTTAYVVLTPDHMEALDKFMDFIRESLKRSINFDLGEIL